MGKATGIFLILAGVGTAALVLPAVDKDAERQLADVVRIATGGAPLVAAQLPVAASLPKLAANGSSASAPNTAALGSTVGGLPPAAVATGGAQPVLMAQPLAITRNGTALPARAVDTAARADLARDIQKELKRVGCYDGELTGDWSPGTRRAMKAFVDRVNAALPIDEPDHILRTMVQGHPGFACGKSCPSGQSIAADGRCLPSAIVAAKSPNRVEQSAQDGTTVARASVPKAAVPRDIADVMATTAVTTGALAANRPAAPKAAWETTIAVAPVGPLPGGEQRMAIGGPAAQTPPAVVPVGPRGALAASTTRTNPAFSNATSPTLPGAIAAFASGAATGQVGTKSETVGPRQPAVRVQKSAALGAEPTEVDSNKPVADVAVVKPQQERARSRPVRQAPPVVFKYPTPSYLGFQAPKFANGGFSKPERSSFGPRIYEGFVRNLR